jgi:catalase
VPAIRRRVVSMLRNASEALAAKVAQGLNISPLPEPMPRAIATPRKPEVKVSPALSLTARPGDGSIKGRKVALLVADGVVGKTVLDVHAAVLAAGAVPRWVAPRIGPVATEDGTSIDADASLENEPGFLFDALALPDGGAATVALAADGHTAEFIKDQYRHCKSILVLGSGQDLLDLAGVPSTLPNGEPDPGIVLSSARDATRSFIERIARHRHFERETDPPAI